MLNEKVLSQWTTPDCPSVRHVIVAGLAGPARYLSTVSVSDAAAGEKDGRRHLGESVKVNKSSLSLEELTDNCGLTHSETLSVASGDEMPDKKKHGNKRRHRDRTSDSSDSDNGQNGRRRPRQQARVFPSSLVTVANARRITVALGT